MVHLTKFALQILTGEECPAGGGKVAGSSSTLKIKLITWWL